MKDSGLNYTESANDIVNPERGFYYAYVLPVTSSDETLYHFEWDRYIENHGIAHLRFGLEEFSAAAGGTDGDIPAAALTAIEHTLASLRSVKKSAIVRFSYDVNGTYNDNEPSMEQIERHIAQLGEVLCRNLDVVVSVETGMLGPWGEQHSTTLAKSGQKTYYRLVEAWLKALPESRTVSVRRPLFYRYWANEKYGKNLTKDNMDGDVTTAGTDAYRVGVYNDGYLGSSTDLGTFDNRATETAWLQKQATHTLYGGEAVADSGSGLMGDYNNGNYLIQEAFITHTSYLNIAWNGNVIAEWKKAAYTGTDTVYAGKTQYDYIAAHLGYRLVLRRSALSASAARGGTLRLAGKIENVGFGNVVNEKVAYILLVSGNATYECATDFDVRSVLSQTTKDYDMTFRLPSDMPAGDYAVYMRVRDKEEKERSPDRGILFANADGCDTALRANKLGTLTVTNEQVPGSSRFEQTGGASLAFTLRFVSQSDAQNMPAEMTVTGGENVLLPNVVPTRKGYTFAGWSDGNKTYAAGERYTVSQNVTFAAVWQKQTYAVTFDGDGGTLTEGEATQRVPYLESATAPVFEKTGHVFSGWDKPFDGVQTDLTVKALWTPEMYTVRFLSREQAELVSGDAAQSVAYGSAATPPVYEREGYRLTGWSGDYSHITGHGVFYAQWEKTGGKKSGCGSSASACAQAGSVLLAAAACVVGIRKRTSKQKVNK